ncbi:unnamed protein product [Linum tenue]|uniref:Uncharacterized protein n=1 Tax=Linum tenue TaxID=586396 RepID=A0AAV0HPP5_9ROSI|nr:unnamed protein product [Linum tenue]
MKKLCVSELLGGRILDRMLPLRRDEIGRSLQRTRNRAEAGEPMDVGGELIRVANNVISVMAMGERCSGGADEADWVRKLVAETAELTGKFNLSDYVWFCKRLDLQGFGKRLEDLRERFDSMMERIIEEHVEARMNKKKKTTVVGGNGGEVKDLLDVLLDIKEDQDSEIKLTRENIKAFIWDIFAAGTESSAITTEWAMAELINHPEILNRARKEIDSVVGKSRLVQESDIPNLPYLQAIVKETMRLHPAAPLIMRESSRDCEIQGYKIPARTRLFVNVWAIGRDPNHWDEPLEFEPERFMDGKMDARGQHFEFLPFGSGRRVCPGTTLALHMVHANLAAMIQCFEWKVHGSTKKGVGLTIPRAHPLICVPVARLHPFPTIEMGDSVTDQ